jgi:hypothetical protein
MTATRLGKTIMNTPWFKRGDETVILEAREDISDVWCMFVILLTALLTGYLIRRTRTR